MIGTTSSDASASQRSSTNIATRMPAMDSTPRQERGDVLRHGLVDGVDVVGEPAHQLARGARLEEGERQRLEVLEQLGAERLSARCETPAISQPATVLEKCVAQQEGPSISSAMRRAPTGRGPR
jgi:hypothetical protein